MLKIFTLLLLFASFLFANIGTVSLVEGKATILRNGQTLGANMGDKIENKDVISTQVNSKIKITFIDNTTQLSHLKPSSFPVTSLNRSIMAVKFSFLLTTSSILAISSKIAKNA
ncbi:hypothetical protein, partial [Aliarcobacter butzleri]|uniref:hypothetical protein n=1 Tax=Aliarcobacter butzleri TaxID=28197 RepID=UPI002739ED83